MQIDLDEGTARMRVEDLRISDAHDVKNSLHGGPTVPATVSFDVRWSGIKQQFQLEDAQNRFRGRYVENKTVTIAWSARQKGFQFVSDSAETSSTVIGVIGHERNGVFFTDE